VTGEAGIYIALAGRISQVLADLDRVMERAESLVTKFRKTSDDGYLDGVALNLHSFYTGVESIFEDIGRTVDDALPSGMNWHQELVRQMSAELSGLRPAVISRSTRDCLDEYRAFRHLIRNVYTFNLRPERLTELAKALPACYKSVRQDLEDFARFLQALSSE
jgi:hypothetical protein